MQQPTDMKKFETRIETLVAERDPTGQTSRAIEELKNDVRSANLLDTLNTELKAMLAEAGRLRETGDVNSEAAKQMVRRWRSLTANIRRPVEAQREVLQGAYADAIAQAEASSEPLPFDLAALDFLKQVRKGMKDRGELD
ncbi:hypothetical protein [Phenylobacterium sp.]|uniref:hypothetical protein n=1 Tax=Phenylobacterium sp. TaxID=1871053 RepID=UPI002E30E61C|nr:hypothetical protein [Phenylobacterium sp.]HEX4711477.1 hypothetical protein [Phenylobacterium sp.]